ncbi:MAG: hypothetical protein Q4C04_07135 [Clostridia bacterium]|nr:hypothetical protein [Clostridia bacterium]
MKGFFKNKLVFTLLCVLAFVILFFGIMFLVIYVGKCSVDSNKDQRSTAEPVAEATPTPLPDRNYDLGTPIDFMPDLSQMNLGTVDEELEENYAQEYWLDITPADVRERIDCVIFKHSERRYTYLYYNGQYIRLDEGTDGYGVMDMILCDVDFDDEDDLIFCYSFGAGDEYASKVGWYDFAEGALVLADFSLMGEELVLMSADGVTCELYRAERSSGETEGGYVLHIIENAALGEVVEQEGRLFLQLNPLS